MMMITMMNAHQNSWLLPEDTRDTMREDAFFTCSELKIILRDQILSKIMILHEQDHLWRELKLFTLKKISFL